MNKKIALFVFLLLFAVTVAGNSVFAQSNKTGSSNSGITIATQLAEIISKNKIEKIEIANDGKNIDSGTEILQISPTVFMLKDGNSSYYINSNQIKYFYLNKTTLWIKF